MVLYKVEITTLCDYTATADDSVVIGQGAAAWVALEGRHDIVIRNEAGDEIEFIPFRSVCHAKVTITNEADQPVVDEVCNETNENPEP